MPNRVALAEDSTEASSPTAARLAEELRIGADREAQERRTRARAEAAEKERMRVEALEKVRREKEAAEVFLRWETCVPNHVQVSSFPHGCLDLADLYITVILKTILLVRRKLFLQLAALKKKNDKVLSLFNDDDADDCGDKLFSVHGNLGRSPVAATTLPPKVPPKGLFDDEDEGGLFD